MGEPRDKLDVAREEYEAAQKRVAEAVVEMERLGKIRDEDDDRRRADDARRLADDMRRKADDARRALDDVTRSEQRKSDG